MEARLILLSLLNKQHKVGGLGSRTSSSCSSERQTLEIDGATVPLPAVRTDLSRVSLA